MQKKLILIEFEDLKKVVILLKASVDKFVPYDTQKIYTPDELECYDSLSFRFEKSIELTLNFFKGLEIFINFETSDTLRDRLLMMQKIDIIDDLEFWIEARILRDKVAHAYLPEQLKDIYSEIENKSPVIFSCLKKIANYLIKNSIID